MKVAICDSERYTSSQLEVMIMDILKWMDVKFEIEVFESGDSLCKELQRQCFDLIFLDVELPGINGIEVSRYIREQLKDYIVKIAYMSNNNNCALELYQFMPIDYLMKPLKEESVRMVLERYFVITEQVDRVFRYRKQTAEHMIPYSKIMYLENRGRKIVFYALDLVDEFYGKIEEVYEELKKYGFLRIHKSIIVNHRFIKNHTYEQIELIDGRRLPISQSRRKEVKSRYTELKN